MNPSREELLFQLALSKPAAKRAAWLDAECDGDAALRQRLESLLAAHEQPATELDAQANRRAEPRRVELHESPSASQGATRDQGLTELGPPMDEAVGQTLGRYKLLERVGEGGCGVVYVAEQTEPVRRRVALKVIKLGMDTKQVVARFEAERQALAMMDHPNIAKVLDAGTTEGSAGWQPAVSPTGSRQVVASSITAMRVSRLLAWLLLLPVFSTKAHPGSGIAVDARGRVFFTTGPMIVMIGANGVARTIVHDQTNEKFYQLHHIQRTPDGGLVTASDMGNAVWRFTPEGRLDRFYPPPDEDRPLSIGLGGDPFALDHAGNLYAVNSRQDRFTQILRISPEGQIRVLAGGDWGFADGVGEQAKFGDLHGGSLLATAEGALLLTDDDYRVRWIAPDGTVTTLAGGGDRGYRDGPGPDARFEGASGLALDARGNVLVVERAGRIRQISTNRIVSTLAGTPKGGSTDGPVATASFDEPTGIAVAPNGDLFVLEPNGPRVRRISNGRVVTILTGLP
jgi:hypothetical protein